MEAVALNPGFWRGRKVLLTGHTGFKGSWLALWLENLGAEVTAVALEPSTDPSLFDVLSPWPELVSLEGDLRDPTVAVTAVKRAQPEIVLHLAAQALVRPSYRNPTETFASNVLGAVNLHEAVRHADGVAVLLIVTSDKVYANDGDNTLPFAEGDRLGGTDPYSASKVCQEIVATCYRESFHRGGRPRIATARAGNVIGGGDWSADRLVPDFVRATQSGNPLLIRHPDATRPWQHVLDPLAGYLAYAEGLYRGEELPLALNFGPPAEHRRSVRHVVEHLAKQWGPGAHWEPDLSETVPEAETLSLDSSLAASCLGWHRRLPLEQALDWTRDWYRAHTEGEDMRAFSVAHIRRYQELAP